MEEAKLTPFNTEGSRREDFYDEWDDYDVDQIPYDEEEDYDMWAEEEEDEDF
ncbi:MAG: hypothetical protein ACW986_09555 [Promethearchaeota archaeon]|jgi:hypothetical protein